MIPVWLLVGLIVAIVAVLVTGALLVAGGESEEGQRS